MKRKVLQFFLKHGDSITSVFDHIDKFMTVVMWIWIVGVFALAIGNFFFFKHQDVGIWQFFAALYYLWYRGERRKNSKLNDELHMHQHALQETMGIIEKVATGKASVHITDDRRVDKKKEKLVN